MAWMISRTGNVYETSYPIYVNENMVETVPAVHWLGTHSEDSEIRKLCFEYILSLIFADYSYLEIKFGRDCLLEHAKLAGFDDSDSGKLLFDLYLNGLDRDKSNSILNSILENGYTPFSNIINPNGLHKLGRFLSFDVDQEFIRLDFKFNQENILYVQISSIEGSHFSCIHGLYKFLSSFQIDFKVTICTDIKALRFRTIMFLGSTQYPADCILRSTLCERLVLLGGQTPRGLPAEYSSSLQYCKSLGTKLVRRSYASMVTAYNNARVLYYQDPSAYILR